ncbi:hypothetical protein [Sphingopyxis sp.]|jgi:hypothetical protein|uniref:hypothetical protein n=1 Tax=Sphingopyxis sp. TaxID=1908224 RepID=UPI002DF104C4|nr:hypothetical protein [Sphingopyxis sp.]
MHDRVAEWRQEGRIFVWRYPKRSKHAGEWHFTGDPAGCRSICDLIDRMGGESACHRTLKIAPVTAAIATVPNFGEPKADRFATMRVAFEPDAGDLSMEADGDKLILTFGNKRLHTLRAAFAEVEVGIGDFGVATSDDRKEKGWWFWWMP